MFVCDVIALIGLIVLCKYPANLSTESELYFMLPIVYVSNISLGLTFSVVPLTLNKSICTCIIHLK